MRNTLVTVGLCLLLSSSLQGQALNMVQMSNWDDNSLPSKSGGFSYSDCWGYAANGREYAIIGTLVGTIFFDITNPLQPVELARFNGGFTNSLWRDYQTYGHYAYAVADETSTTQKSSLQIFDLSGLPYTITKVYDSFVFFERCHSIYLDVPRGRLYCAGANTRNNGLIVLDVATNPANPTLLASVPLPGGYVHEVYARNDTVYASHGFNGLYIYDFRNATNPVLLAQHSNYPQAGYNHTSWLSKNGRHLVFTDETHGLPLRILNISNLNNISLVSSFASTLLAPMATNSLAHNPYVRGDTLVVSYYHDGVQVYNIANPANPQRVAYFDTEPGNLNYSYYSGCWGAYPFLPSGRIVASDISRGMFVLEMLNPILDINRWPLYAEVSTNEVKLSWEAQPLLHIRRYRVEKSQDGVVFSACGQLEAEAGASWYTVRDPHPFPGRSLYRVIGWDGTGQIHQSSVFEVFITETGFDAQLTPNPVQSGSRMQMMVKTANSGPLRLNWADSRGAVVWESIHTVNTGCEQQALDIKSLAPGVYTVRFSFEGRQKQQRIVVLPD